ncbi:MAG: hypothetical protein JSS49_09440 [Planctomycetes bacterium]|nr:hypothetical protein [Planctomycetota bacterium]
MGWIRLLYVCTAMMGISTGLIIALAPDRFARNIIGIPYCLPAQDRIVFGLVGCFWLTMGLMALLGLRAPLRFLPIFLIQLVYKSCWFLFVFFPLIVTGNFPNHGWSTVVVNAVWMSMDLKAIPWRYLLSKDSGTDLQQATGTTARV